MDLQDFVDTASQHPEILDLPLEAVFRFVQYVFMAKPTIYFETLDARQPPPLPSPTVLFLLARSVGLNIKTIKILWNAFKIVIWSSAGFGEPNDEEIAWYNKHALPLGTSE